MSRMYQGDYGIVIHKNGTAAGTYVDCFGSTQNITALTTSYAAQGDSPVGTRYPSVMIIGVRNALTLFIDVALSVATGVSAKLQVRYDNNGNWMDIQSVRGDTGATLAEHTFVAGSFALQTASITATGECRVVVKATAGGPLALADAIEIRARSL